MEIEPKLKGIRIGVDGSRLRSGGGIAHLVGILSIDDPTILGISEIHLWAHRKLLDRLPNKKWLIKHHPSALEQGLLRQLTWQRFSLAKELQEARCDILFSADVTTLCSFKPMVVLNHSMLAYDEGVLQLFGISKDRIQQALIYFIQKAAFRRANGSIFLTKHASVRVQHLVGPLQGTVCIPHGVAEIFKHTKAYAQWPKNGERPIRCLYVSPVHEYKHQPEVVRAVQILRNRGVNLELILVGGGGRRALKILSRVIDEVDPERSFVSSLDFIKNEEVAALIAQSDLFVFASSCETFGIALLEAMTVGIPIACSDRSSLPETLQDGGEYFDPQNTGSIAQAIDRLIQSADLRAAVSTRAQALAAQYSWSRCAVDTWQFLVKMHFESIKTASE